MMAGDVNNKQQQTNYKINSPNRCWCNQAIGWAVTALTHATRRERAQLRQISKIIKSHNYCGRPTANNAWRGRCGCMHACAFKLCRKRNYTLRATQRQQGPRFQMRIDISFGCARARAPFFSLEFQPAHTSSAHASHERTTTLHTRRDCLIISHDVLSVPRKRSRDDFYYIYSCINQRCAQTLGRTRTRSRTRERACEHYK